MVQGHFPSTILCPGQMYTHDIVYRFGLHIGTMMPLQAILEDEDDMEEGEEMLQEEEVDQQREADLY